MTDQVWATGHVSAASTALVLGLVVLMLPKGTRRHRRTGTGYVVALILVDVAALALHRDSAFGVFHVLAVLSLVTIAVGIVPLLAGKRSAAAITTHAYCMSWSYAGLVAAGTGQLAVALGQDDGPVVPLTIVAVLCVSGALVFGRVPGTVERVLVRTW